MKTMRLQDGPKIQSCLSENLEKALTYKNRHLYSKQRIERKTNSLRKLWASSVTLNSWHQTLTKFKKVHL